MPSYFLPKPRIYAPDNCPQPENRQKWANEHQKDLKDPDHVMVCNGCNNLIYNIQSQRKICQLLGGFEIESLDDL